jgi:hypothetical protein
MIETLKEKILSWTPEQADTFYNNVVRMSQFGGMIYEKTNTGWFLYSAEKAAYYDLNGETHVLSQFSHDLELSLDAQKVYSDYADANDLVKLEKPVTVINVSIYAMPYIYYKLVRPYGTHGIPQLNMLYVSADQISSNGLEVAKVNFKKMDEMFQLIDACGGTLYPRELNTENLHYDPVTDNYFWAGDILFNESRTHSVEGHINMIPNVSYYAGVILGTSVNLQAAITNFVNSECTILQLPQ